MKGYILEDDFGRRTVFDGDQLIDETTDTEDARKPQWVEIGVWRTEAGRFVVQRTTRYRVNHVVQACPKADGYELVEATKADSYPCPVCNKGGTFTGVWAQAPRISVDAYSTPQELIESFKLDGRYSNLARAILADLSEQDEAVNAAWNTVVVP